MAVQCMLPMWAGVRMPHAQPSLLRNAVNHQRAGNIAMVWHSCECRIRMTAFLE